MGYAQTITRKSTSKRVGEVWLTVYEKDGSKSLPTGYDSFNPYTYENKKGVTIQEPGIKQAIAMAEAEGFNQFTYKLKTLQSGSQLIEIWASNTTRK